jgi:hypothetical protein
MEIEIKEVTADTPPLKDPTSVYQLIYDRALKLKTNERFRAELKNKFLAYRAAAGLRSFGEHKGLKFTITIVGGTMEIKRVESTQ